MVLCIEQDLEWVEWCWLYLHRAPSRHMYGHDLRPWLTYLSTLAIHHTLAASQESPRLDLRCGWKTGVEDKNAISFYSIICQVTKNGNDTWWLKMLFFFGRERIIWRSKLEKYDLRSTSVKNFINAIDIINFKNFISTFKCSSWRTGVEVVYIIKNAMLFSATKSIPSTM